MLAGLVLCVLGKGQTLVESVAAIVGNEVIYLSDIENSTMDAKETIQGPSGGSAMQCLSGAAYIQAVS